MLAIPYISSLQNGVSYKYTKINLNRISFSKKKKKKKKNWKEISNGILNKIFTEGFCSFSFVCIKVCSWVNNKFYNYDIFCISFKWVGNSLNESLRTFKLEEHVT